RVHLSDARRLLLACLRNFTHDFHYALDAGDDVSHGASGCVNVLATLLDLENRSVDERLYLFGRCCRALRKCADLRRNDRKAAAMFPGACSFNRGVQGEDIGLECNTVDHAYDVDDTLR